MPSQPHYPTAAILSALSPAMDTTKIYNNIDFDNWVYPMMDINSNDLFRGANNAYLGPSNFIIAFNTVINGGDDGSTGYGNSPPYKTAIATIEPLTGGASCLVAGNFTVGGAASDTCASDISTVNGGSTPIFRNNRFSPDANVMSFLADTSNYYNVSATSPLNSQVATIPGIPWVDFLGRPRNSTATIGAMEYSTNNIPLVMVANAGSNQTITLPTNTGNLDGSQSYATGGSIVSYSWSQVSGNPGASIQNPSAITTTVSGLQSGIYIFQLTITSNVGTTSTAQVTIFVNGTNPTLVANAGNNQTITLPTNTVNLDGTQSKAKGETITAYSWTQLSGNGSASIVNGNSATPTVNGLQAGQYIFQLTITSSLGTTATAQVTVTVNTVSTNLVANAGNNQTITLPTNSVTLDGTQSNATGQTISSYSWSQISGNGGASIVNGNTATPTVKGLQAGQYVFQLTITSSLGTTATAQVTVTVNPVSTNLVANAGNNQTITLPTNSVNLDGSQSYATGESITAYSWTQISGGGGITLLNATSINPSVAGLQVGQYVFQLVITGSTGNTASAQVTITVNASPTSINANAGNDTTIALPSNSVVLDGSNSTPSSGGTITSYSWTQISGPNSAYIVTSNAPVTNVYGLDAGVYVFQLTVTDNTGASATSTVADTVLDNLRIASKSTISLYPNPTSNNLNLQITSDSLGRLLIYVYDMLGNIVMAKEFDKESSFYTTAINVYTLPNAAYTLQAIINNKAVLVSKFIKQ